MDRLHHNDYLHTFKMKILFSNLISTFVFLTLNFISDNSVGAADPYFETCTVPRSCGNQTISFPFYIQGEQEHYCGYPRFNLSCDPNGRSILNFSGQNYVVHQIFYQNQSLLVSTAAFSDPRDERECVPPVRNFTSSPDFELPANQASVVLLYNCRSSSLGAALSKYRIGCSAVNDSNSVLAFYENDRDGLANASRTCGTERVVAKAAAAEEVGYRDGSSVNGGAVMREVLRRGFMLNWIASNCSRCESTKGRCGFDWDSRLFQCYCPDRPHAARCDMPGKSGALEAGKAIAGTIAGIGIVIVVLLVCRLRKKSWNAFIFFWKKQNQTCENVEAFLKNYGPIQVRRYSYSDIKKMTNSFKEKLGQGGFGDVYKGKLDDGFLVAVKVLNQSKGEDGQEFINEVATISRTSHVNVVTLFGFCFDGRRRALIYEFMPNGSLEKFVFDESATENSHQLDWETHYQISLGIARGLEYLHRGCNTRILHFDIKPHNILLDADFVPKISDFGLAKICTRNESLVSMLGPRGTVGYIAPEVFSRNFGGVSHKSDVYSYGMMILEMVGGRRNINVRVDNTSEIYFPHWIYRRLVLDEELGLKRVTNEEDRVKVKKMILVSLWCIQTDPSNRPAMGRVIEMLEGSLDSLEIPPKPFLSSPSRPPPQPESSGTFLLMQI
ncbi:GPCR kinase [Parasponia andersonii]|uniref:non-specific serine/threonine protein kinase n=1 Tax=Parasponia andersonii TaxID=3476 RepID=A0A2P5DZE7_PARAD|nr:GPCR kinase [Parasponia andersonii]